MEAGSAPGGVLGRWRRRSPGGSRWSEDCVLAARGGGGRSSLRLAEEGGPEEAVQAATARRRKSGSSGAGGGRRGVGARAVLQAGGAGRGNQGCASAGEVAARCARRRRSVERGGGAQGMVAADVRGGRGRREAAAGAVAGWRVEVG